MDKCEFCDNHVDLACEECGCYLCLQHLCEDRWVNPNTLERWKICIICRHQECYDYGCDCAHHIKTES